jgi:hypothetical protein
VKWGWIETISKAIVALIETKGEDSQIEYKSQREALAESLKIDLSGFNIDHNSLTLIPAKRDERAYRALSTLSTLYRSENNLSDLKEDNQGFVQLHRSQSSISRTQQVLPEILATKPPRPVRVAPALVEPPPVIRQAPPQEQPTSGTAQESAFQTAYLNALALNELPITPASTTEKLTPAEASHRGAFLAALSPMDESVPLVPRKKGPQHPMSSPEDRACQCNLL